MYFQARPHLAIDQTAKRGVWKVPYVIWIQKPKTNYNKARAILLVWSRTFYFDYRLLPYFSKMKKWLPHITVYKCIIYCLVAFCLLLYSGIFLQQVSLEAMYQGRTCSHCPKRAPPYCKTSILSYPKISISKCCSRFRCECSNLQPAWTHLRCKLHLL